jgi:antitoxin component of RelBE/YafQ-DinJ toxin-antitoxin module
MPEDWNNGLESEPVTTYVDEKTKEAWKEHAEALGMSLSRFVESMVNAGRSLHEGSAPEGYEEVDAASARREAEALRQELEALENGDSVDAAEVYSVLEASDGHETVETVADSVDADESAVYEALQALLDEGLVEYDTMRNAYTA